MTGGRHPQAEKIIISALFFIITTLLDRRSIISHNSLPIVMVNGAMKYAGNRRFWSARSVCIPVLHSDRRVSRSILKGFVLRGVLAWLLKGKTTTKTITK